VAAAVLLFAVCAAAFVTGYRADSAKSQQPAAAAAPTQPSPAAPTPASTPAPTLAPEPPLREPQQVVKTKPAAARKAASSDDADFVELRVLRPAQQAEWRGDFAAALAAIAEHQRRFPSGQLTEEREGLRVRALLGLGRVDEAQSAGAAFRRRFPHSALLERIDAMLEKHR
jgi:TolA-binding protein